ncbi:MAG: hypothetical protein U5J83_09545 [Bryobacterales bacterium]|nr:hypothetical protein [Bryobacterales bacterium]
MGDVLFLMDGLTATKIAMTSVAAFAGLAAMAVASARPEGYKEPIEKVDWEGFKARIRAENSVRLITEGESGEPLSTVANGIYGHSFSPSFGNPVPLFYKSTFQCFELHKLPNGDQVILGCVTKQVAATLAAGEFATFRLFPEPYDDAVAPIVLNFKHIVRSNNRVSRDRGNYIEFDAKVSG